MEVNKKRIMVLAEGLTVIAVLAGFLFLILTRLNQSKHPLIPKIREWMSKKPEVNPPVPEVLQQTWQEKRSIL